MADMIRSMAHVGEMPWHGNSVELPAGAGIPEMIAAAKLDYKLEKRQLQMADGRKVDRFAVVRTDNGAIVADAIGPDYKLLQNDRAFEWFRPYLDGGLATLECAGELFGGSRVWVLAKLNRTQDVIVPRADDTVAAYITLAHAHDGTMAIRAGFTGQRIVCHNTLSVALGEGGLIKIRHSKSAGQALKAAQDTILAAGQQFDKAAEIFRALAATKFNNTQLTAYLQALFPRATSKKEIEAQARATHGAGDFASLLERPAHIEDMDAPKFSRAHDKIVEILESGGRGLDLPGVQGTAWAAYNAVTEYLTWEHGRTEDARFDNVMFGAAGPKALQGAVSAFLG